MFPLSFAVVILLVVTISALPATISDSDGKFLGLEIRDIDGADLTQNVTIYQTQTASKLRKRGLTPITCSQDGFLEFAGSACDRTRNAQDWICRMATDQGMLAGYPQTQTGSCAATSICVDGIAHPNHPGMLTAYCHDIESMIDIAQTIDQAAWRDQGVSKAYDPPRAGLKAVEAIFTGPTMTDGITLPAIKIEGQKSFLQLGVGEQWKTQQENYCEGCSSLGLQPVDKSVSRIVYKARFPEAFAGANLFISTL